MDQLHALQCCSFAGGCVCCIFVSRETGGLPLRYSHSYAESTSRNLSVTAEQNMAAMRYISEDTHNLAVFIRECE
jgi:hypothetical protein